MSEKKIFTRAASDIATRAELEQRIKARPKPRHELHLTISGTEEHTVHAEVNAANEDRIRDLQKRLDALRNGARGPQAHARLSGKAKGDFGRTR